MANSKMDGKRDYHSMLCNNQPLTSNVEAVEKPIFSRNFFSQSAALAALFCF